jgi:hypothetical protein
MPMAAVVAEGFGRIVGEPQVTEEVFDDLWSPERPTTLSVSETRQVKFTRTNAPSKRVYVYHRFSFLTFAVGPGVSSLYTKGE